MHNWRVCWVIFVDTGNNDMIEELRMKGDQLEWNSKSYCILLYVIIIHSPFYNISIDCINSSILWDIFCHFFWAAIIFFNSAYWFQWALKTDGSMRMKQCGKVWKCFWVEVLGQRFGLKVKEVLYHEKSEYQVWNRIDDESEGYPCIRLRKLWKSACFGWSDSSNRKGWVCISRNDNSSSSLCSS